MDREAINLDWLQIPIGYRANRDAIGQFVTNLASSARLQDLRSRVQTPEDLQALMFDLTRQLREKVDYLGYARIDVAADGRLKFVLTSYDRRLLGGSPDSGYQRGAVSVESHSERVAFKKRKTKERQYGIELEMQYRGNGQGEGLQAIKASLAEKNIQHVMKHDGSIASPGGVELVLEPLTISEIDDTFRVHASPLRRVFRELGDGCGMHVHVGIEQLHGTIHALRLMNMNQKIWEYDEDFYLGIYGREPNTYCNLGYTHQRIASAVKMHMAASNKASTRFEEGLSRYAAIALTKHGTIEFRGFDSRLQRDWISERMRIVDALLKASLDFPWKGDRSEKGLMLEEHAVQSLRDKMVNEKLIVINSNNTEQ